MQLARSLVAAGLLAISSLDNDASAYINPPSFSPAQPLAGQAITMHVRAGVCHGFGAGEEEVEVTVDGEIVEVVIDGIISYGLQCISPDFDYSFDIGSVPPGNYTVRILIRSLVPPYQVSVPLISAPLAVSAAVSPHSVPASAWASNAILAGLVLMLSWLSLRDRSMR